MLDRILTFLGVETLDAREIESLETMRIRAIVLEHKAREAWRAYVHARIALAQTREEIKQ